METKPEVSVLEIKRVFKAAQQDVFNALTQPEIMAQWFFGIPGGSARIDNDFRVGGKLTIHMFKPDGSKADDCAEYSPHGEYLEIDEPNKVSFSWISEGFVEYSMVTFKLNPVEGGIELTLQHSLPEAAIPEHNEGWTTCLQHFAENCFELVQ